MRFCIDIDGTICQTPGVDYESAIPIPTAVRAIQDLKNSGHYVILFTARGSGSGLDLSEVTQKQLALWGVPYDELRFGKPFADFYLDDKAVLAADWHKEIENRGVVSGFHAEQIQEVYSNALAL